MLKKHFLLLLLSVLKMFVLRNIDVETTIYTFLTKIIWLERKEMHLFEIEIFCKNIVNL